MRSGIVASVVLLCVVAGAIPSDAVPQAADPFPKNLELPGLGFEETSPNAVMLGWRLQTSSPQSFRLDVSAEGRQGRGALLQSLGDADSYSETEAYVLRDLDAGMLSGRQIRFTAWARTETPSVSWAWLGIRSEGANGQPTRFMSDLSGARIADPNWRAYSVTADIPVGAKSVTIGAGLRGPGRLWLDEAKVEVLGPSGRAELPPRPLGPRGQANLETFARLVGLVRYFHPSDEAAAADWAAQVIAALPEVEAASGEAELRERLQAFLAPLGPTAQVTTRPQSVVAPSWPQSAEGLTAWRHWGGQWEAFSTFRSVRQDEPFRAPKVVKVDIGQGLWAIFPVELPKLDGRTWPSSGGGGGNPALGQPTPSASDRNTRLAAVILLWTAVNHFSPDVLDGRVNWGAALGPALRSAATDDDGLAFERTLSRLMARLPDGHVTVGYTERSGTLPLRVQLIGGRSVVTASTEGSAVQPGDVIEAIDGVPVQRLLRQAGREVGAATPQSRGYKAAWRMVRGPLGSEAALTLATPVGRRRVSLQRTAEAPSPVRPPNLSEVAPGIIYVDGGRTSDEVFEQHLSRMASAAAVVIDLRSYPVFYDSILSPLHDGAMIHQPILVPVLTEPTAWRYERHINLVPKGAAKLDTRVVFVADEGTLSRPETLLSVVKAYRLGPVVGAPTSGTTGNPSRIHLPGGYAVSWTGMKVLTYDCSRFNGAGIAPDVPVRPTLAGVRAGRDEVLDMAVAIAADENHAIWRRFEPHSASLPDRDCLRATNERQAELGR